MAKNMKKQPHDHDHMDYFHECFPDSETCRLQIKDCLLQPFFCLETLPCSAKVIGSGPVPPHCGMSPGRKILLSVDMDSPHTRPTGVSMEFLPKKGASPCLHQRLDMFKCCPRVWALLDTFGSYLGCNKIPAACNRKPKKTVDWCKLPNVTLIEVWQTHVYGETTEKKHQHALLVTTFQADWPIFIIFCAEFICYMLAKFLFAHTHYPNILR